MSRKICLFEDSNYKNLLPLVYFRPVYDLRCGIFTLKEKLQRYYNTDEVIHHSRNSLVNILKENKSAVLNEVEEDQILFINGRTVVNKEFAGTIPLEGADEIFLKENTLAAARLSGSSLKTFLETNTELIEKYDNLDIKKTQIDCTFINYPWEAVNLNASEIESDFELLAVQKQSQKLEGVNLINRDKIFIGEGTTIKPNVFLDAEKGPVYIGENVKILPGAYIEGPTFIGDNTLVKANATIYHGTSIGEVCKVAGEIEASIIHSYSNKQHEGYLGHSYLGSWVNIGASSNNSDLKNNYGTVKVELNGESIDTESQFVGLIMGDHSKCGINTMFNTGTVVGASCNIYGGDFPPKYIPSFSWGGSNGLITYELRKAIEVAKVVKSRRNINMSIADLDLFKKVFETTKRERKEYGVK